MSIAISATRARPVTPAVIKRFPGTVKNAGWSRGSGIRLGSPPGFFVDVSVNPTTKIHAKAHLDAKTGTINVTLTGKPGRPNRAMDISRELRLGIPSGVQMFHAYTLVVKDAGGHVLKRTPVRTMLAE